MIIKSLYDFLLAATDDPKLINNHTMTSYEGSSRLARKLSPILRRAVAFRVDESVVRAAQDLATGFPDVFAELTRRVRLPYDEAFLEWGNIHSSEATAPEVVGVLCERGPDETLTIHAASPSPPASGRRKVGLAPVSVFFSPDVELASHSGSAHAFYRGRSTPRLVEKDIIPPSVRERGFDHHLTVLIVFGNFPWQHRSYEEAPAQWDATLDVSRRCRLELNRFQEVERYMSDETEVKIQRAPWIGPGLTRGPRGHFVRESLDFDFVELFGLFKLPLAVLALLNARDRFVHASEERPAGKFFIAGKYRPYAVRRTATLRLPLERTLREAKTMAVRMMAKRRRHRVMGHWCSSNLRGDPSHDHRYADVSPRLKECECGHRCWWRSPCERGDASLGYVSKDYELEGRARQQPTRGGST